MSHHSTKLCAALALLLAATAARAQESTSLPTIDTLNKQMSDKDYRGALRDTTRLLSLRGKAAENIDPYPLWMLRAECNLQLKNSAEAIRCYQQARTAAIAEKKLELTYAPLAYATIFQRATAFEYHPKVAGAKPISLFDLETRKQACKALLDETLPAFEKRLAGAPQWNSAQVVLDAARDVGILYALEQVSSGTDARTKDDVQKVADRYTQLVTQPLSTMTDSVGRISTDANLVVTRPIPVYDPVTKQTTMQKVTTRNGISKSEYNDLDAMADTCAKIAKAAADVVNSTGLMNDSVKSVAANAEALRSQINVLVNDDYSKVPAAVTPTPGPGPDPSVPGKP